ncbi:dicarboxylate/amino acid:cation symporter [Eggerthellaceae bacterium zg-1084]|uniref:Dicarboxylate/amino acid:cation symporter n=2 Tax=Berryella wangjianweii TaxID=2734634 RepID=A0A6M8IW30_9ACTN|nr:dicarboxylate/amino acid:cation symporter [Berryella wangjianweii]NPD31314.1 dicarboxylate/amino acid:cation symporter [Berryella wangjianweii]QKF06855.1 dicarboxylate/amino acid:cation symporter [Berryella wangjianweii]
MTTSHASSPPQGTPARKEMGQTTWILISLLAGIVLGIVLNLFVTKGDPIDTYFVEGVCYVLGQGFIRMMQMLVVPLVFCSIVVGAASIADPKMLGKIGGSTVIMYLVTTALAIIIAMGLASLTNPGMGLNLDQIVKVEPKAAEPLAFRDVLVNIIPTNVFGSLSSGSMLQIIFFALLLGFILGRLGSKVATVNRFFTQFNAVMMRMITIVLKVAPVGIFFLITRTFTNLGFSGVLPMVNFVGTVYIGLAIQLLVVYMVILFLFTRLSPLHFLRKFVPVMLFAFTTSSSNATIPLNMETLEKRIGVSPKVTSFTIPLGATINMDGTAIMQGAAVIFAAQAFGIDMSAAALLAVIVTATAASIGTAGVPGSGTIMLTMVFASVGLPAEGVAMIMGIDRILDMGRTAINVTGDGVVTTCVANAAGMLDRSVFVKDDIEAVDRTALAESDRPQTVEEYTKAEAGCEIGESGELDQFANVENPDPAK